MYVHEVYIIYIYMQGQNEDQVYVLVHIIQKLYMNRTNPDISVLTVLSKFHYISTVPLNYICV